MMQACVLVGVCLALAWAQNLPTSYRSDMMLSINSTYFGPAPVATAGRIFVDGQSKLSKFYYPTDLSLGGHVDIIDWSGAEAIDYFWHFAGNGTIYGCEKGPFGDGSNRTPFYKLSRLSNTKFVGTKVIRLSEVKCYYTSVRETTQCYQTQGGEPWFVSSTWNGQNTWDFGDFYPVDTFPAGTFDLPSCFDE